MKKIFVILSAILVAALVALGILVSIQNHNLQSDVKFSDCMSQHSAFYPINGGMLTVAPEIRMNFDSASPVSTITRSDLEKLKNHGMEVDSISTLYIGMDVNRHIIMATKIYQVSLPAPSFEVDPTRSRCIAFMADFSTPCHLANVKFLLTDAPYSTLGMDFIERFVVEYSWATGMIVLHDKVPDGYQQFASLESEVALVDKIFSPAPQYFLTMEVDGRTNDFLVDTSISRITINIPETDGVKARVSYPDPYLFDGCYARARREPDQLVMIGNRAKYQAIHRSKVVDKGEKYFCNPLNMFVSDVVLDFPGENLLIRRGSRMVHSPGFGLPVE